MSNGYMEPVSISTLSVMLKTISKVCPILLRRRFTEARLGQLIRFDISASGDGVTYNHANQESLCWLTVVNLSPFDFTIDKITLDVVLDAGTFSAMVIMPEQIKGAQIKKILVRSKCPMTLEAAKFAKEKSTRARVGVTASVQSAIRPFMAGQYIEDIRNFSIMV